mmetsp:Transcript_20567/g.72656  ORF Transcript_20567/g.72656 Transcript_20567/m.72656 type:complete len:298 (+) Transcript_20567:496-1389(+)
MARAFRVHAATSAAVAVELVTAVSERPRPAQRSASPPDSCVAMGAGVGDAQAGAACVASTKRARAASRSAGSGAAHSSTMRGGAAARASRVARPTVHVAAGGGAAASPLLTPRAITLPARRTAGRPSTVAFGIKRPTERAASSHDVRTTLTRFPAAVLADDGRAVAAALPAPPAAAAARVRGAAGIAAKAGADATPNHLYVGIGQISATNAGASNGASSGGRFGLRPCFAIGNTTPASAAARTQFMSSVVTRSPLAAAAAWERSRAARAARAMSSSFENSSTASAFSCSLASVSSEL